MKQEINFKKLNEIYNGYSHVIRDFRRLGIFIEQNPFGLNIKFNWQENDFINRTVNSLGFFDELTFQDKLALALAVNQEECNAYTNENEIKKVNNFFDVKIDFEIVQKLNARFI